MGFGRRPRRMRLLLGVAILACGIALAKPAWAAAGWPLDEAGSVLLGFGASYSSAEATSASTHRGIDIAADKGSAVRAPLAGRVTFSGRVPAAGGGTCRAVTIATDSGAVTLLPLASTRVSKGDELAAAASVGTLAEEGDASSAAVHLHVGVKRGDVYIDPLSLLALPAQGSAGAHEGEAAEARSASPVRASGSGARGDARGTAASGGRSSAPAAPPSPLRAPVPGTAVAPGVTVAGAGGSSRQVAGGEAEDARAEARAQAAAAPGMARVQPAANVAEWLGSLARVAAEATKAASLGAFALLAALGALWPLWRRDRQKGLGEDCVSAAGDDVAAVVGR